MASDPQTIWLQGRADVDPSVGRMWCEHPDPDGEAWIKYVLASAELEALIGALRDYDKGGPGYGSGECQLDEMIKRVRLFVRSLPNG